MDSEETQEPTDSGQSPYRSPYSQEPVAAVEAELARPVGQNLSLTGLLAWLVVFVVAGGIFSLVIASQFFGETPVEGDANAMELKPIEMQAKALVGQKNLIANSPTPIIPPELDSGSYEQRLCYSIILNELQSSTQALKHIEETKAKADASDFTLTEDQERLTDVVTELFETYEDGNSDSSAIAPQDRDFLKEKLNWLGELALYPVDSPHTVERAAVISQATSLMMLGIILMLALMFSGFVGFILALVFGVMSFSGKLNWQFTNKPTNHNVYIETFAIWMLMFVGSSVVLQLLRIEDKSVLMMLHPVVFFLSLSALVWPAFRGVLFRTDSPRHWLDVSKSNQGKSYRGPGFISQPYRSLFPDSSLPRF